MNPAGWVGDQDNTWDGYGLTLALKNIFISADSGYAAVGSDIGGYLNNDYPPDRNLFLRWVQLGALLPIMENGGQKDNCHLPWLFDPIQSTTDIYRKYAKLHHELVPYFYSYDIQAHSDGISISRPIGHDISDWEGHWEYLLGDNLFVSAIYQDNDTQYSDSKKINFPTGKWINYWNEDEIYNGETSATLTYSLDQYPIFIRSGAIIPMNVDDSETGHGSDSSENYLTLLIYPDGVSSFDYHSDPSTTTRITTDEQCGGIIISFNSYTDSVIIRLKNDVEPERVFLSGNLNLQKKDSFTEFEAPSSGWYHGKLNDSANVYTWIKIVNPTDSIFVATNSVSGITPTAYKLSNLNVGNNQYIDRPSMKLVYIPDEYKGFNMIRTANDNKITTNLGFQFYVCGNADIYVAYDY
ncbi:MAG TPA: TIM-barrel domain-containing protein, partial [Ignavibacteriaceae bacterium]|nr:TIM-barrel domain-containing protein [Ignavibacteriaceae bacterium]